MTLAMDWERCVRTRAVEASCHACVDACPVGAIDLGGPRASVRVDVEKCTQCGLCQPACPTEALAGAVDVTAFLAAAGPELACTATFCLGALHAEDLLALAVRHGRLSVDLAGCETCRAGMRGVRALGHRLAQVREFIVASGVKATLVMGRGRGGPVSSALQRPPASDDGRHGRRAFLGLFVPPLRETPAPRPPLELHPARLDAARLRRAEVPVRRRRLLAALATAPRDGPPRRLEANAVDFTSGKALDTGTCTACQRCVAGCPTGALTSSRLKDQLSFDLAACVRCGTCHDVCQPRAITLASAFDTGTFLAPGPRLLGTLPMAACGDCGALFRRDGDDGRCPRCRGLDEEARELLGGGGAA